MAKVFHVFLLLVGSLHRFAAAKAMREPGIACLMSSAWLAEGRELLRPMRAGFKMAPRASCQINKLASIPETAGMGFLPAPRATSLGGAVVVQRGKMGRSMSQMGHGTKPLAR